ncbi:MAG: DUF1802 family protein [Candidatus Hodarchaeota archaeon]
MENYAWYTYATDVLAYSDPNSYSILGITRTTTCKWLLEKPHFFLFPKDTTRHVKDIFKKKAHDYYDQKHQLVLPDDNYLIKTIAKIPEATAFKVSPDFTDKESLAFIKALGTFSNWTPEHLNNYLTGKGVEQQGSKFGDFAVFILRVFLLERPFIIKREQREKVSNQTFVIEVLGEFDSNKVQPVLEDSKFKELENTVTYLINIFIKNNDGEILN